MLTSDRLRELGSRDDQHTSRNNANHADVLHGTLVCFCSQVQDGYSLLNTQKVARLLTNRAECLHCNQSEKLSQQPTPQACAWKKTKSSSGLLYLGDEYLQTLRKLHVVLKQLWHRQDGCSLLAMALFSQRRQLVGVTSNFSNNKYFSIQELHALSLLQGSLATKL